MSKDLNSMIDEVKEEIYDSCVLEKVVLSSKISRIIHWLPDGYFKNNLIYSIYNKCNHDFKNGVQKDIIIQDDIVKILRRINSDFEFVISQNELDELYTKLQTLCNNDACTTENVVKSINQVCDFNIDVNDEFNSTFIRAISGFCMACKAFVSISSDVSIKSNIKTFLNSYITITYGDMMSITNSLFGTGSMKDPTSMFMGKPGMMGGMNPMMSNEGYADWWLNIQKEIEAARENINLNPMMERMTGFNGSVMGMPGMMGNPFFSEADRQTNINVLTGLCNVARYITNSMHTRNDTEIRALGKINAAIIEAIETFGRS